MNNINNDKRKRLLSLSLLNMQENKLEISLLNIQGLTQQEQTEIKEIMTSYTIMCITETQLKYLTA